MNKARVWATTIRTCRDAVDSARAIRLDGM
jgi:hypothetical protein